AVDEVRLARVGAGEVVDAEAPAAEAFRRRVREPRREVREADGPEDAGEARRRAGREREAGVVAEVVLAAREGGEREPVAGAAGGGGRGAGGGPAPAGRSRRSP